MANFLARLYSSDRTSRGWIDESTGQPRVHVFNFSRVGFADVIDEIAIATLQLRIIWVLSADLSVQIFRARRRTGGRRALSTSYARHCFNSRGSLDFPKAAAYLQATLGGQRMPTYSRWRTKGTATARSCSRHRTRSTLTVTDREIPGLGSLNEAARSAPSWRRVDLRWQSWEGVRIPPTLITVGMLKQSRLSLTGGGLKGPAVSGARRVRPRIATAHAVPRAFTTRR